MKQQSLWNRKETADRLKRLNILSKRKEAADSNAFAARIILEQPDRYGGIMVDWAKRIVAVSILQPENTGK